MKKEDKINKQELLILLLMISIVMIGCLVIVDSITSYMQEMSEIKIKYQEFLEIQNS